MNGRIHKIALLLVAVSASISVGDIITHGATSVDIGFVSIGNAGNAADTSGYGAVSYGYQIGQYEVTASQWTTVASAAGISQTGSGSGSQPIGTVSWTDAAKFCNWLTSGDKNSGVYQFDISGTFTGLDRSAASSLYGTIYVLPTEDEWYKAAYYTGSGYSLYANGTGTPPVAGIDAAYDNSTTEPWSVGSGTIEQNGTYDMMGNIDEMLEGAFDGALDVPNEQRVWRGGSFGSSDYKLASSFRQDINSETYTADYIGFRVAVIPEPATLPLVGFVCAVGLWIRRRRAY
jgi:formylglycine-generating enzyme required for sulfatase activity